MNRTLCTVGASVFALILACTGALHAGDKQPVTITVAAAASLQYSFVDKLIPMFQQEYPWITVQGTYDSSGKLQAQIENGLDADVFMSAAMRQMNTLKEKGFIDSGSVIELLENKIVLIKPRNSTIAITDFSQAPDADMIAVGDPDSVPAGQYAREAFTTLGVWEQVAAKASFGTNVTEVLNWVAEGSADIGVVYATDAATTEKVEVICEAPDKSLKQKVIYPVGMLSGSSHKAEAALFIDFLASGPALAVFAQYGFSPNQ